MQPRSTSSTDLHDKGPTPRRLPPALIALSPGITSESTALAFAGTIRVCVRAGLRGVLLREPGLSDRATLELALALRDALGDGWLCVHDRLHLAAACRADAVHVGWRSLRPAVARTVIGKDVALGFSAHAGDDVLVWKACDYVFFGPVRATASKQGLREPVGFEGLSNAASATPTPVWALGGLEPEDVPRVFESGGRGLCVLGGIARAADPAAACARYVDALRVLGR